MHWGSEVVKLTYGWNFSLSLSKQKKNQSRKQSQLRRNQGQLLKALTCRKMWLWHRPTPMLVDLWIGHQGREDLDQRQVQVLDRAEAVEEGPPRDNSLWKLHSCRIVFTTRTISVHFTAGDINRHKHIQQDVGIPQGHSLCLLRSSYLLLISTTTWGLPEVIFENCPLNYKQCGFLSIL